MTDYSTYTIEGAFAILIVAIAYKVHRMRCDSSSNCCGESIAIRTHNEGEGQGRYELSQRQISNPTPLEQQV
jgi:hypothetical protein